MQLTSILLLSAAISVSALPAAIEDSPAIEARRAPEASTSSGLKSAEFACDQSDTILGEQVAQMSKLKTQNISIPPYLAGYYTALHSGRQEIGCPGSLSTGKRDFTPTKEPCQVAREQHGRMMALVNRFQNDNIAVPPFIAGHLSAAQDEHKALGCPPFTGPGANETVTDAAGADSTTDSASD